MRAVARIVFRFAGAAVLISWFLMLRPMSLGGPASYVIVSGKSMLPTLHAGDLVLTEHHSGYQPGDLVAYRLTGKLVIHRIVGGNGVDGYLMRGDNNRAVDPWHPTDADVVGASRFVVAKGGVPLAHLRHDPLLVACLADATALFVTLRRNAKVSAPSPRSRRAPELRAS